MEQTKHLLTNDLVLVTGEDKEIKDLDTLATDKVEKLAIGDPESVFQQENMLKKF